VGVLEVEVGLYGPLPSWGSAKAEVKAVKVMRAATTAINFFMLNLRFLSTR